MQLLQENQTRVEDAKQQVEGKKVQAKEYQASIEAFLKQLFKFVR